jgi:hypothetical protein
MTFSFFIARLLLSSGRLLLYGFDPFVVAFDSERDVAGADRFSSLMTFSFFMARLLLTFGRLQLCGFDPFFRGLRFRTGCSGGPSASPA